MGGRGGRSTKKNSRKEKLNEKNSCTPINPKKYSCYGLKKIHTRNLITKKNSYGSKIPLPPPISFLMVRPLEYRIFVVIFQQLLLVFILQLLKAQTKYLGRNWRKSNMKTMSAIYQKVRHRLNDDWAYGNGEWRKRWI